MTTELEDRLRADLPRLAELIERDTAPDVVPLPAKRRTHRLVALSVAACVALAAVIVAVTARGGNLASVAAVAPRFTRQLGRRLDRS